MSAAVETPQDLLARAEALRPALIERQEETERLACYPEATHRDFLDAGFYRLLTPRRFGGFELDFASYLKVMIEVARGCPSTGWSLCLPNGHTLLLASLYPEEAQTALLSDHFFAASFGAPVGEAVPVDGGWHLTGTWPYSSGIAWSTHFMGQTMVPGETKPMLFVAPRSSWEMLDDWGDSLGLKGSRRTASASTAASSTSCSACTSWSWSTSTSTSRRRATCSTATRCTPGARWGCSCAS